MMRFYVGVPREAFEEWEWDAIDDGSAAGGSLQLPVPYVAPSKSRILDLVDHLDDAAIGTIEVSIDDFALFLANGLPPTVPVQWLGTVGLMIRRSAIAAGNLVRTGRVAPTGER